MFLGCDAQDEPEFEAQRVSVGHGRSDAHGSSVGRGKTQTGASRLAVPS